MKLFKIICEKPSPTPTDGKVVSTKVFALSNSSLNVNFNISPNLGRIKKKDCIGPVEVLDLTTKKDTASIIPYVLFKIVMGGYGKTLYVLADSGGIDFVERSFLKYTHSKNARIPEENVDFSEADQKNYYSSIEELGICFLVEDN
jgi:hypothetical protein